MKRCIPLILLTLALCACTPGTGESVVWQDILPQSGVELAVSGCGLEVKETDLTRPEEENPQSVMLLCADDAALLTLDAEAEVKIAFASPKETGYALYTKTTPIEKVDYVPLTEEDGRQCYRFDTAYSFVLTVESESGTDTLVLDCRREI